MVSWLGFDTDANDVEVKFMYSSAKKQTNLALRNAGPVWYKAENIVIVCEALTCDNKEVYSLNDDIISKVEQYMKCKDTKQDEKHKNRNSTVFMVTLVLLITSFIQ